MRPNPLRTALRRRVTLLAPVREETPGGGADVSYEAAATVWAGVTARGGRESDAGGRLHTRATWELTLRFRADAAPGWQAEWSGGRRRVIAAHDPDGRRRTTILICEEEI